MIKKITTNDKINELIYRYYKEYYSPLTPTWKDILKDLLNEERNYERFQNIRLLTGLEELSGKTMLEVGSGFGSFVISANQNNITCCGIEPDTYAISASKELFRENRIPITTCKAVGEQMPFGDECFDLVVSFQVLEHTQDPEKVLAEAIRVLKPGGFLYFDVPNHNFVWEAHYGLIWPTFLPKSLTKWYLKMKKRDPSFFDTIQILNRKKLDRYLKGKDIEITGFGEELWEKRLDTVSFSTYGHTKKLMNVLKLLERLKILKIIKAITVKLNLFYPLIVVGRKSQRTEKQN